MKCPKCGSVMVCNGHTPTGKQRWVCRPTKDRYCYSTTSAVGVLRDQAGRKSPRKKSPLFKRDIGRPERYVVTFAQNATPVHKGFVNALQVFCNHNNAELLVIPGRYKNPTSRWTKSQANEETWAPEVAPYLWNVRRALNRNIVLLGDIKTQPTAISPLTGFESITHGESGILGHTKLQLKTIPAPQGKLPKIMTTTGACTVPNYTDSKAGKLGEFHHCLGAALVEIQGGKFHLRQINADKATGSFIDLDTHYGVDWFSSGIAPAQRAEALILGDMHVGATDPKVIRATFYPGGMIDALKPKRLIWHDLFDGYSVNPHHNGNPFVAIAKRRGDRCSVRAEVEKAVQFVVDHTPADTQSIIVASNHDDFLRRWVIATDWRTDPENAEFYLETALAVARETKFQNGGSSYPSPFAYWAERLAPDNVKVLKTGESFSVGEVELGMHGHEGPGGSRGSIKNLRRIGVKSIIGHSHGPGIEEGCVQVGTSSFRLLEYITGPSSSLNTHGVLYSNHKRSLLNMIEGEWRL